MAFLPAGLNAFGPVKRDVFVLIAAPVVLLAGARAWSGGGGPLRALLGEPLFWPLAAAALAGGWRAAAWGGPAGPVLAALERSLAILLAVALLAEAEGSRLARRILLAHLAGAALAGGYGIVQHAGLDPLAWQRGFALGAPGSTYGNPLFLADGLAAALVTAVAFGVAARGWEARGWAAAALGLGYALLVTHARGAWLGTGTGIGIALLLGAAGRARARAALAVALASAALVAGLSVPGPQNPRGHSVLRSAATLLNPGRDEFRGRRLLWEATFRMLAERPVLGWGPGELRRRYTEYQARLLREERYAGIPYHSTSHAHSDYLQLAAETGLVGLGIVGWALAVIWRTLAAARDGKVVGTCGPVRTAAAGVLAAWLVDAWFNGPLHIPPSSMLCWPLVAIAGRRRGDAAGNLPPPARPAHWAAGLLGLVLAVPAARDLAGEGYLQAAMFSLESGRPAEAVPAALRASVLALEDRRHFYVLGQAYAALGRDEDAMAAYREDVANNPAFASGWEGLADVARRLGRIPQEEAARAEAARLNPSAGRAPR